MKLFNMTLNNLHELYLNELRDLYSAETQLIDALPKMAGAATSPELKNAFFSHLDQTKEHAERLRHIFLRLNEDPDGETCEAMKGLIKEGEGYVKAGGSDEVRDAGLIGAAQRVEHYEMAGYGTARSLATRLWETDAANLLQMTLDEEGEADKLLTEIAESSVNASAVGQ
jgi:ferritin-like metal-binding protein YciE